MIYQSTALQLNPFVKHILSRREHGIVVLRKTQSISQKSCRPIAN